MESKFEFGKRLKDFRVGRDWTLEQVANITGVPASTLSRIENGLVDPNDRTAFKIKKAFPVLADEEPQEVA